MTIVANSKTSSTYVRRVHLLSTAVGVSRFWFDVGRSIRTPLLGEIKSVKMVLPIVLMITLLAISKTVTATTNQLGWSAEQANRWSQMHSQNHPLWQRLKNEADDLTIPANDGIRDGLVYLITGDVEYARSAYNQIAFWAGRSKPGVEPARNETARQFGSLALLYSWIADALPRADKNNLRDILEHWSNLVLNQNHGTRTDNSREVTGHYFGIVLFALAIQNDDPSRAAVLLNSGKVGGLTATSASRDTWRNALADYAKKAVGGGWLESSQSNIETLLQYLEYSRAINAFYGQNQFPEATDLLPEFERTLTQELTPDLSDSYQWGNLRGAHDLTLYLRIPLLTLIAELTDNPQTSFLSDFLYRSQNAPVQSHFYLFVDPYTKQNAPAGWSAHNAVGRGLAYYHSEWQPTDSFFGSWHQTPSATQHDSGLATNFGLYRVGQWVVDYPRGYKLSPAYSNTLLISGGLGSAQEARGQTDFEAGDSFLYHVGTTGGNTITGNQPDILPELIHEWTRSYLYLHNPDQSDSIIIFDRINSSNPLKDITPAQFNRFPLKNQADISAAQARHQWIIHVPDANPIMNGNAVTWYAQGGEQVKLHSYLSSNYTTTVSSDHSHNLVGEIDSNELAYQLRLVPTQKSGWQTMLNIVHSGSDATTAKFSAVSGEKAEAVLIDTGLEGVLAVFNSDSGPLPHTINGNSVAIQASNLQSGNNSKRLADLKQLRFFKSGFNLKVNTQSHTKVYLADLDPNLSWFLTIDGSEQPLAPSDAGLAQFDISAPGSHSIQVDTQKTSIFSAPPPITITNSAIPAPSVARISSQPVPASVSAAVKELVIDNRDRANTTSTRNWKTSKGPNPWAGESVFNGKNAKFRWIPVIQTAGKYKVYAWWTYSKSRSTNVPYRIKHSTGTAKKIVNQRNSSLGGRWNLLGTYNFPSGSSSYIEVSSENGPANADAVRFVPTTPANKLIVDNRDQANTTSTRNWKTSKGPNPWAGESVFNGKNAKFRWIPVIQTAGKYKVYAWWTYSKSRSTNVPYRIKHSTGTAKKIVNQRNSSLGGRWNLLGTYNFPSGSSSYIEVSSENGPANADAVRLTRTTQPPTKPKQWWEKSIFSAALHPNSASQITKLAQLGGFGRGRMQIDFGIKVVDSVPGDPVLPVAANKFGYFLPDSDPIGTKIPVPVGASIEGSNNMSCNIDNNDCHYIVKQGNTLYETWQATRSAGKLKARTLAVWNLNKVLPASGRGEHCTSADAAGFPIEPLLWNADEITASLAKDSTGGGNLGHAIRFILPNARMASDPNLGGVSGRLYVRPASHAGGPSGPKGSVAYGARLRLRANFPLAGYNAATRVVINTMKRYGIVLADGGTIALTAESDFYTNTKWPNLGIDSRVFDRTPGTRPIKASDFQVIDTGSRIGETYNCVRNN